MTSADTRSAGARPPDAIAGQGLYGGSVVRETDLKLTDGRTLHVYDARPDGAGLAPLRADELDWFAGMTASGQASLHAADCPQAELRLYPDDGHISVLNSAAAALDWIHDLSADG